MTATGTVLELPMSELRSNLNKQNPSVSGICTSVKTKSYSEFSRAATTSRAFLQVLQDIPLRPSISSAIFSCIGSSSTTRTFLGNIVIVLWSDLSSSTNSFVSGKGSSSLNTLPLPSVLSTSIFPSKTLINPLVRKSPKPKPSELTSCAARSNGANILFIVSSSIPIPVSLISIRSFPSEYSV